MSKPEHVQLARQGSQAIAQWREQHPGERLDFSKAILSNHNLNRAYLSETDLSGADLIGVRLNHANLSGAVLREAISLMGQFHGANLSYADLSHATLRRADLSGACLIGADLTGANLAGAVLSGANLENAVLVGADFSEANLNGANLSGADLSRAELNNADLTEANLTGANLGKTTLYRTLLNGTLLKGAVMFHTVFGDCDLSQADGLDQVKHEGPSAIGIDTIFRSASDMPESFLRSAGVPEDSITYQRTLAAGSPNRFYTCFISCCTGDQDFTERLRADLQARGVRCWCFAADSRGGRWISEGIDRGIRYYDKLVVVCSEDSLGAERVREEITHGIQKQAETGRWLFFPVAVSDVAYNPRNRYVRGTQLRRHVMFDFRGWEDPKVYNAALDTLIGDLSRDQEASAGMAPAEEEES